VLLNSGISKMLQDMAELAFHAERSEFAAALKSMEKVKLKFFDVEAKF